MEPKLFKQNDGHGVWYLPYQLESSHSSGYKVCDGVLFESGNMMAYSSEYDREEIQWSPVVNFNSVLIMELLSSQLDIDLSNIPISKNEDLIFDLKKEKGYFFDDYSGEFVKADDISSFCKNLYQNYFHDHGFLDGGCAALSLAIKQSLPSSILMGCYDADNLLEHVLVEHEGLYIDGNGLFEDEYSLIKAFNEQSMRKCLFVKEVDQTEINVRGIPLYLDKIPMISSDLIDCGVIADIVNNSEPVLTSENQTLTR